mmetsp:Transcript_86790/g.158916  ORF Transcript_86790/g.158916 Transcript_86790/m.158916 type:complete len:228 (+) Transcript_86790:1-684(+)
MKGRKVADALAAAAAQRAGSKNLSDGNQSLPAGWQSGNGKHMFHHMDLSSLEYSPARQGFAGATSTMPDLPAAKHEDEDSQADEPGRVGFHKACPQLLGAACTMPDLPEMEANFSPDEDAESIDENLEYSDNDNDCTGRMNFDRLSQSTQASTPSALMSPEASVHKVSDALCHDMMTERMSQLVPNVNPPQRLGSKPRRPLAVHAPGGKKPQFRRLRMGIAKMLGTS